MMRFKNSFIPELPMHPYGPRFIKIDDIGRPRRVIPFLHEIALLVLERRCHVHLAADPQEQRAHPVGLPPERIPPPRELPESREKDQPEEVRKDEGEGPREDGDEDGDPACTVEELSQGQAEKAGPDMEQHPLARIGKDGEIQPADEVVQGVRNGADGRLKYGGWPDNEKPGPDDNEHEDGPAAHG